MTFLQEFWVQFVDFAFGQTADYAVFGLGALGFFVWRQLSNFLNFEGDLLLDTVEVTEANWGLTI